MPEEEGTSSTFRGEIQLENLSRGSQSCQLELKHREEAWERFSSKAAYGQAERERAGGKHSRWGKRAGQKTDDLALMKHILLILSEHPPVLCAPTPEGRLPGRWVQS